MNDQPLSNTTIRTQHTIQAPTSFPAGEDTSLHGSPQVMTCSNDDARWPVSSLGVQPITRVSDWSTKHLAMWILVQNIPTRCGNAHIERTRWPARLACFRGLNSRPTFEMVVDAWVLRKQACRGWSHLLSPPTNSSRIASWLQFTLHPTACGIFLSRQFLRGQRGYPPPQIEYWRTRSCIIVQLHRTT